MTLERPAIAPIFTAMANQPMYGSLDSTAIRLTAVAIGAGPSSEAYGTMPTSTAHVAI